MTPDDTPTTTAADRRDTSDGNEAATEGSRAGIGTRSGGAGDMADAGRAVRSVGGLTIISRIAGLLRDLVTVRIFGDTAVGSAFAAAFAVPNLFRRLFGEGALSAAFLPAYARLLKTDTAAAHAIASLVIGLLAVITGVVALLAGGVLITLAVTLPDDPVRTFSLLLVAAMLPYMPLICVAAILGGMLQAHGRFGPWAAAPIILNACILIAAGPFFAAENPDPKRWAFYIAAAIVAAGAAQIVWSLIMLRGCARWTRRFNAAKDEARALLKRIIPALIGLGALQLNAFLDTLIAMWPNWVGPTILGRPYPLDEASNAVLFYAQRLYQFPLGVFGIAVATVVFPQLARASTEPTAFVRTLRNGVRLSFFIAMPASVGLLLVREPLVQTVYTGLGDGFSAGGVARASSVVLGYAVAIWSYSLVHVMTRAFYALGDTRTPMTVSLITVAVNLALNLVLIWPLKEAGLAWSTASASVLQVAILGAIARRRFGPGSLLDTGARISLVRTIVLSASMGAAVLLTNLLLPAPASWAANAGVLGVLILVGAGTFTAGAVLAHAPELAWLRGRNSAHPAGSADTPPNDGDSDSPSITGTSS